MSDQHEQTPVHPAADGNGRGAPLNLAHEPVSVSGHAQVDRQDHAHAAPTDTPPDLTAIERALLADLFAIVEEHAEEVVRKVDRHRVGEAFVFACEHHADQRRQSGEDFITHPVGVAKICAGMRLDTETLCAALLHDTVEDTSASLEEVRRRASATRSPASSTA